MPGNFDRTGFLLIAQSQSFALRQLEAKVNFRLLFACDIVVQFNSQMSRVKEDPTALTDGMGGRVERLKARPAG